MKKLRTPVLLSLFVLSASLVADVESEQPMSLSAIELITVGERFDGKVIQVIGIPYVDFEASYLFASKDAFQSGDTAASVYLKFDEPPELDFDTLNGKYVYVIGRFRELERTPLKDNEVVIGPPEAAGIIQVSQIVPVSMGQ